jgi:Cu(I)/Ag(I) efflux system protein CusF
MSRIHTLVCSIALALAAGAGLPLHAQTVAPAAAASADRKAAMTEGEVRKVDRKTKKITLKHGEIENLDMGPMTMVFQVSDARLLDKVKAGDKIRFRAANQGGKLMVTDIQPLK